MNLLGDSGAIYSLYDRANCHRGSVVEIVRNQRIILPILTLPEIDYLVRRRLGRVAEEAFLEALDPSLFELEPLRETT